MIRYHATMIALIVLTTLTFALSFLDLGSASIPVAIAIAVTKSVLIALFFMHLAEQRTSNWVAFVTAVLLVVTLIGLTLLDAASRVRAPLEPALAAVTDAPAAPGGRTSTGARRDARS